MKKEIITIAGKPGSGKSTTANILAQLLGYERYSAGSFLRTIAEDRGISIEEASRLALEDASIDKDMDARVTSIGTTQSKMVIDGRLAFHFIPQSFKVYLELDLKVAAERIFREDEMARIARGEMAKTETALYEDISARFQSEQLRYQGLYHINPHQHSYFDLVLDTTDQSPDDVAQQIVNAYQKWLEA